MINFKNENIIIIGLGITGLSCVKYFHKYNIFPKILDMKSPSDKTKKSINHLIYHFGKFKKTWILQSTLIIISPGIPLSHPYLIQAKNIGIKIIGDVELFSCEINKCSKKKKIIAITGTNGKSTVTKMVEKIAKYAGLKVGVGGNIGFPILELLYKPYQLYILELSSFQLETTYSLKPLVATILNIAENHMNRYPKGIKEYLSAKLKIYQNAKICLINTDNPLTKPKQKKNYISFGNNCGNYYLHKCKNKQIWLTTKKNKLLNVNHMKIYGKHNYINALSALALADSINIPRHFSILALKKFKGLSHRLELIHKHNNILWINDSKSTNIESTKAAIKEVKKKSHTIHLILGGDGKSKNFLPLKPYIQEKNFNLYCIGKSGPKLFSLKPNISTLTNTLEEAMHIIKNRVKEKDIVLLSPACSSLDQFKNFEERGKIFTKLAKTLQNT
ncbi:UDP-N-acetylmuramoylalanine--D-glutamate ligase [Candidatus Westeberhardia cardiocondylae]|uniref:UDP-N-acetylmuramoylalanine--D-glutamate ligase n=1 Tax=Candidatus Westeberhardia cardiocondylae TaxID=1594731 RepID=A0A0H5BWM7_9ENTR|nr:UDP-N-acetylmuramoyl-L-alanine--D-glutamate ligase [Candidatus Westeberhardia cardiocondylae]MCR3756272.1 UDP-N-acetylmuramoyl-L-alanine--D-glutamate ligase [Candidatus Westeberhardia cardiocondylae]CEN32112.1 UDP-N-acetylmuramoylalanine--D-glutamate ligase [Candidatus Westeberhardia cardiocondylae]